MLMEFADEKTNPFSSSSFANSVSPKIFFTPVCASSKFPWMPTTRVLSPRCYHLLFLDGRYSALGIKDNDPCSGNIGKSRKCRFSGISAGRGKDYDLFFQTVLLSSRGHQMGKKAESHVLECDGRTVPELKII